MTPKGFLRRVSGRDRPAPTCWPGVPWGSTWTLPKLYTLPPTPCSLECPKLSAQQSLVDLGGPWLISPPQTSFLSGPQPGGVLSSASCLGDRPGAWRCLQQAAGSLLHTGFFSHLWAKRVKVKLCKSRISPRVLQCVLQLCLRLGSACHCG